MYIEITPFWIDSISMMNDTHSGNIKKGAEYYKEGLSRVIELGQIKQYIPEKLPDGSGVFIRLKINEDPHDDLLISATEGEEIKKKLLALNGNSLSNNIAILTTVLRNLYELLRARLH